MNASGNRLGAFLTAVSALAFVINDAAMKWVLEFIPLFQALVVRGVIAVPLICLTMIITRQLITSLSRNDAQLIALRTLSEIGTTYFLLMSLKNMPISHVTLILQAAPLGLTLVAALMMGELVTWRRWSAIVLGFIGVVIIIRPGTAEFSPYAFFAVLTVICIVIRDMVTRRISPEIPSLPIAGLTAVTIMVLGLVMMPTVEPVMPTLFHLALVSVAAVAILIAYLLSVQIMRLGHVGFVAQFRYTAAVWSIILGFLFFGEIPDEWTVTGALLIMATGIYTLRVDR